MKRLYRLLAAVSLALVIGSVGGADQEYMPFWQGAGQAYIAMGCLFLFTHLANKIPKEDKQ